LPGAREAADGYASMAADDSQTEVPRLSLTEIHALDSELDRVAAATPFRLKPGVTSSNSVAVAGFDGHLFIGDGANRWERQYRGEFNVPAEWIAAWLNLFERRQAEAARRGVVLWNLVIPEKQPVLPQARWGPQPPDGARRPLKLLLTALGLEARLYYAAEALIALRSQAPAYLRHNSHWTPSGCCSALLGLLGAMGVAVDAESLRLPCRRVQLSHDLAAHFFDVAPQEPTSVLEPAGVYTFEARTFAATGRHTGSQYGLHNPEAPDPRRVIVFGDSFSFDAGFAVALSAVFRDVVFVWEKKVLWDRVETDRADLVVWQSAERFLATVPEA
jgi:hypothetical protein